LITRAAAFPRGVTYTPVCQFIWDSVDHCPVLSLRATIMSEDLCNFLVDQIITINLIKRIIIKKFPKASVMLQKTRGSLSDLKTLWEKTQHLHSKITLATTVEDRKKLSYYFLQDEFFAVEDAYKAADQLQDAMSNFVKVLSPLCGGNTDYISRRNCPR